MFKCPYPFEVSYIKSCPLALYLTLNDCVIIMSVNISGFNNTAFLGKQLTASLDELCGTTRFSTMFIIYHNSISPLLQMLLKHWLSTSQTHPLPTKFTQTFSFVHSHSLSVVFSHQSHGTHNNNYSSTMIPQRQPSDHNSLHYITLNLSLWLMVRMKTSV